MYTCMHTNIILAQPHKTHHLAEGVIYIAYGLTCCVQYCTAYRLSVECLGDAHVQLRHSCPLSLVARKRNSSFDLPRFAHRHRQWQY